MFGPAPPPSRARARPTVGWLIPAVGLGVAGVVLVVLGTFLPWVWSGGRSYRSYAVAGLVDRLDVVDNSVVRVVLDIWPFVGPLCLGPLVLAALRLRRTAGWAAVAIGLAVAAGAAVALHYTTGIDVPGVTVAPTGPWTVIAGGVTMAAAGILALAVRPAG